MKAIHRATWWLFGGSVTLMGYTFVGYPLLLAVWARLRPRPIRTAHDYTPCVSLIIAAYNEEAVIEAKLANCHALDYPPEQLEVIVAADGSDDRTAELAGRDTRVTVLHQSQRRGKVAAINRAVDVAQGEILVFSDANNRYLPETLRRLVAPFADPAVGVVTGRKAIDDGSGRPLDRAEGLYFRYESKIKDWESRIGSVTGVSGEILAVRRAAFRPPPAGTVLDDFMLAMHAALDGWRVAYAPDAISLEPASATLSDEAMRRTNIVTGRYQALWRLFPEMLRRPQLAWQVISHKALRALIPFAMLAAGLSNLWLARWTRLARVLMLLQTTFYSAAALGWWNERQGRRNRWLYLPYYFCRVNFAAVRGLQRFLSRGNPALWPKVRRG